MNTNTQEKINTIIIDILQGTKNVGSDIYNVGKEGISKAIDFAQEQTPLVVQEFLRWEFVNAIYTAGVLFGVVCIILFLIRQAIKGKVGSFDLTVYIFGSFGLVLSVFFMFMNINQVIKIKLAPRIYLIEWVSDQVHNRR